VVLVVEHTAEEPGGRREAQSQPIPAPAPLEKTGFRAGIRPLVACDIRMRVSRRMGAKRKREKVEAEYHGSWVELPRHPPDRQGEKWT